jgi:signal transduction histidine kinase/CheY-like chemotaxis protein
MKVLNIKRKQIMEKGTVKRHLYFQIALVLLIFGIVLFTNDLIEKRFERDYLKVGTEATLSNIKAHFIADLQELKTMLGVISESIRGKLLRNADFYEIKTYIGDVTEYGSNKVQSTGFRSVFAVFQIFNERGYNGLGWEKGLDRDLPWYTAAMESGGEIATTDPHINAETQEVVFTFARSISDADGKVIAIVCIEVLLCEIYKFFLENHVDSDYFWILLDSQLTIVAHPLPGFLGLSLREVGGTFAELANALEQGDVVSGRMIKSHDDKMVIASIRQIYNDWHFCVLTHMEQYYADQRSRKWILAVLGIILSAGLIIIFMRIAREKDRVFDEKNALSNIENILTELDTMIYITDPETNTILFINNYMKQQYGINDDCVGQPCYKVLQEGMDEQCSFCPIRRLEKDPSKSVVWEEYNTVTKRYYRNTDKYINWPDGRVVHLQHSLDITDLKAIKDQLVTAKDVAEQANKAKTNFLAMMSHEIRTPMNAILGTAEIQLQNEIYGMSPETEKAFNIIYGSGNLLLSIINDILDLSKIEANKMDILSVNYDIPSLISDTIQLNLIHYENKPVQFNLTIDENTPLNMFGDELRTRQILSNILSNAFKYTDKGEIELSVSAEIENKTPGADSRCVLILRVRDTGQGMTEEQIAQLFDEYARFNVSAAHTVMGTGLGMNITKRLVDLMGGEILVESVPEKGSVFTVRLPQERVGSDVCGAGLAEKMRHGLFQNMSRLRKTQIAREYMPYGRVLVVDDAASNLYVARGLLLPYGLKVETAASGFEAVEKIRADSVYDIVFMDHMMPGMDGMEAVKIIRDMGYTRPIVALTANALMGQEEIFLANGFDGFLAKPIVMRELNALLNSLVRDRQQPEVLEAASRAALEKAASQKREISGIEKFFTLDAKKTISVLKSVYEKMSARESGAFKDADREAYTIAAHRIKGALATIGEKKLSGLAHRLESAGKGRDLAIMTGETPALIDALQALIEKFKPEEAYDAAELSPEDRAFLLEKMHEIKAACEAFDERSAKAALFDLKQKTWPREINDIADEISVSILHGEFEIAASAAEKPASTYTVPAQKDTGMQ